MNTNLPFNHYIITRFSLIINNKVPSDQWYEHRVSVFKKYTIPSVLGQTDQNFKWICLIGQLQDKKYFENTPIIPVLVTPQQNFKRRIRTVLEEYSRDKILITTRLDNDDALHKDHIRLIHKLTYDQNDFVINPINGLVLDTETGEVLQRRILYPNPFITLIEKPNQFKTVYFVKHGDMDKHFIMRMQEQPHMWLMICHKFNLANRTIGKAIKNVDFSSLKSVGYNMSD